MVFGVFWVLLAVAVGILASNRGRSGLAWFVLALLISPLLGFVFCLVSRDLSKSVGVTAVEVEAPNGVRPDNSKQAMLIVAAIVAATIVLVYAVGLMLKS